MAYFNCTILIDDDPITNYLNSKIIQRMKISAEIKQALNGMEGLKLVEKQCETTAECPELILLDINMPVMSGLEFLKEYEKIKCKNKKRVIIVMLTTSTHEKDVAKVNKYEVSGYLNKPLTEEKLANLINKFSNQNN